MAKNNNLTDFLTGVADAIRAKKGTTDLINPQDFESEISSIKTEKPEQEKSVSISTNGTTEVTPDSGKVLTKVSVITNVQPTLQEKTVAPTTTQQIVTADSGKDGLSKVTVEAVTADIDSNITAENIKKDVTILDVTGTYDPTPTKLNTPIITLSSGIINWNAIENATTYIIYQNDVFLSATQSLNFNTNNVVGNYKIKAIASGYIDSNFSNNVRVAISNLTGYTWTANDKATMGDLMPQPSPSPTQYDITGIMNNNTVEGMAMYYNNTSWSNLSRISVSFNGSLGTTFQLDYPAKGHVFLPTDEMNLRGEQWRVLQITGGADATNAKVISWFEKNGTLTPSQT